MLSFFKQHLQVHSHRISIFLQQHLCKKQIFREGHFYIGFDCFRDPHFTGSKCFHKGGIIGKLFQFLLSFTECLKQYISAEGLGSLYRPQIFPGNSSCNKSFFIGFLDGIRYFLCGNASAGNFRSVKRFQKKKMIRKGTGGIMHSNISTFFRQCLHSIINRFLPAASPVHKNYFLPFE